MDMDLYCAETAAELLAGPDGQEIDFECLGRAALLASLAGLHPSEEDFVRGVTEVAARADWAGVTATAAAARAMLCDWQTQAGIG